MTNVSNACAVLTHVTIYSITSTDDYVYGNSRLYAMLMVTMRSRIWTWIGKPLKTNSFDFDFY